MVIVTKLCYPPDRAPDMAKRFMEAPAIPDFMTRKGPYICTTRANGIESISLFELDNADMAQGIESINNYMTTFFSIPGFRYEVMPSLEISEAMKVIGMA